MGALVSKLALGTWKMGGTKEPDPNNDDEKDIEIIRLALDQGVTLIDTAQNYAAGKCEELVGEAIKTFPRGSYQILTKQYTKNLSYDGVIQGCQESLKRLGVDWIDYFVCHAPNADFDMHDFFKATNQLYKDGLIKNVGVSNFGPKMLQLAIDTSELPIGLNQVSFSLVDDDIISTGTYESCLKNNIPVQAYRTLASLNEDAKVMQLLEEIAKAKNFTPYQVALAYINSFDGIVFTIRASTKKHWDEIKQAMEIKLEVDEIERLKLIQKNKQGIFRDLLLV